MARTVLSIQELAQFGEGLTDITQTAADATNDHEFINSGREILLIINEDASSKTVDAQLNSSAATHGEAGPKSITVAAGEIGVLGPFDPGAYNQDGDSASGMVLLDLTADTSLTLAVLRLPK